jgi:hypothetical protein
MITADIHVFGSHRGYTTLARSMGVTDSEKSALETLGFGQADDESYRTSLESEPALFGRVLSTGRVALTRCLPGEPDDAGRSTLRFVSALFDGLDWQRTLASRIQSLAMEPTLWMQPAAGLVRPVPLHASRLRETVFPTDLTLATLDAWLLYRRDPKVLVLLPDTDDGRKAVMGVLRLLPIADRLAYSFTLRALSAGVAATVGTLAVAGDSRRKIIRPAEARTLEHPYCRAVLNFWRSSGEFPAAFVNGVETADRVTSAAFALPEEFPKQSSRGYGTGLGWWASGGSAVLLAAGVATWLYMRNQQTEPRPDTGKADERAETTPVPVADQLEEQWTRRRSWSRGELAEFIAVAARHGNGQPQVVFPWRSSDNAATLPFDRLGLAIVAREWVIDGERCLKALAAPGVRGQLSVSAAVDLAYGLLNHKPHGIADGEVASLSSALTKAMEAVLPTTSEPERSGETIPAPPPAPKEPLADSVPSKETPNAK